MARFGKSVDSGVRNKQADAQATAPEPALPAQPVPSVPVCWSCQANAPAPVVIVDHRSATACAVCGREGIGHWDHCQIETASSLSAPARPGTRQYVRGGEWVDTVTSRDARAGGWSAVPVAPAPEPEPAPDPDS